jgi:hypothetical protein
MRYFGGAKYDFPTRSETELAHPLIDIIVVDALGWFLVAGFDRWVAPIALLQHHFE